MNYKEEIKNLLEKEGKVLVGWNAGGDQTPVYFYTIENGEKKYKDNEIYRELRWQIIEELSLPNASERYHKGQGKICLNEKRKVVLEFTSKEYEIDDSTDYDWDEWSNELTVWSEETSFREESLDKQQTKVLDRIYLEDKFDITSHLNRLEIKLLGEFNAELTSHTWVNITIIHGDKFELENQINVFYRGKIQKVLDTLMQKYLDKDFIGIYIEGILQSDHSVQFKLVENAYTILNIYNNKQIVLID